MSESFAKSHISDKNFERKINFLYAYGNLYFYKRVITKSWTSYILLKMKIYYPKMRKKI